MREQPLPGTFRIGTLNLRNIADRWPERLPLLLADMAAEQPDVLGLQECVFAIGQDRLLAAAGDGRYGIRRAWAGRPEYGNAALARDPLELGEAQRLDLGRNRSALRVPVLGDGRLLFELAVTHLHHVPADAGVRDGQVRDLVAWLDVGVDRPLVVVGDFNATPSEPAYARMAAAGFRSAFLEANRAEPQYTWPSGIQAEGIDTDGSPGCLDYIWLRGALTATAARLAFDRPAADDSTLYPTDHLGIVATVALT